MRFKIVAIIAVFLWVNTAFGIKGPERDPSWWLSEARFVYHQGDLMGALQIIKEARRRFPGKLTREFKCLEAQVLYDMGKPQETVKLLEPLSISYELPDESLLLLAKAYLKLKDFGKALFYARLVEKKTSRRDLSCQAKGIVAKAYLANRIKAKAVKKAQEILESACSDKVKAQALEVLIEGGYSPEEIQNFFRKFPALKLYAPKFFRHLGDFYLSRKKLEKAEKAYFRYLNLSGEEEEAPAILFKLAEAYFHQNRLRRARFYYELLLTAWPHLDEAKFAKFRLYHLNYIFHKKLGLPTLKERKVLIPLINELRKKYPTNKITEEAQVLEVRLYLEDKKPDKAFFTAIDFIKRYPQSKMINEVYGLLCEADSLYLQKLYGEKKDFEILALDREYQEFLKSATCGPHFYWLGKLFEKYHLETQAKYYLIQAYEFGVPKGWEPELTLVLAEKAIVSGKVEVATQLLKLLIQKYPFYAQNPTYLYLKGLYAYKTGRWLEARKFFKKILSQKKLSPEIKSKTLSSFFSLALKSKDIDLAFELLKDQDFPSGENEFAFLIQMTLENEDYLRAKKILAFAEKRFPDSVTLKWLKGLLLERLGQENEALGVWKELSGKETTEGKLAQGILRSLELVEEAREVIY